ncbi:hypothetical protein L596_030034 [Steinernema carpocapsae]|uniref:Uncharacterized protein n=1 Tax=Steinernema carpocapsae TaxID=34508 RepID=A0A4U5LRJ7_STECR|nr:hypothetical protein L596_030034 [Steinernema carpocapsae]
MSGRNVERFQKEIALLSTPTLRILSFVGQRETAWNASNTRSVMVLPECELASEATGGYSLLALLIPVVLSVYGCDL